MEDSGGNSVSGQGANHKQMQWTPFHLDILYWHESDYYLEVQLDPHKDRILLFLMNLFYSTGPGDVNQDQREIQCDEWQETEKKKHSCSVVFVVIQSNDLAECSTSGSISSLYFSIKFRDLTDN